MLYTHGMSTALVLILLLAGAPARAAAPAGGATAALLAKAEEGAARLGALAAGVQKAFRQPIPGTADARAAIVAGLVQDLADECGRTFKVEDHATPAFLSDREKLLPYLACKAAAARSAAPCAVLSAAATSAHAKDENAAMSLGRNAPPHMECRSLAGWQLLADAVIRSSKDPICGLAAYAFLDLPGPQRGGTCAALLSAGTPAQICARTSAASGGGDPKDFPDCAALLALRGAASDRACADKNLEPDAAAGCRAAFAAAKDPECAALAAAASANYCKETAAARVASKEFRAEVDRRSAKNPRTSAIEEFHAKRVETEGLLARVETALRSAPNEALAARLRKARAAEAEAVRTVQAAAGR